MAQVFDSTTVAAMQSAGLHRLLPPTFFNMRKGLIKLAMASGCPYKVVFATATARSAPQSTPATCVEEKLTRQPCPTEAAAVAVPVKQLAASAT